MGVFKKIFRKKKAGKSKVSSEGEHLADGNSNNDSRQPNKLTQLNAGRKQDQPRSPANRSGVSSQQHISRSTEPPVVGILSPKNNYSSPNVYNSGAGNTGHQSRQSPRQGEDLNNFNSAGNGQATRLSQQQLQNFDLHNNRNQPRMSHPMYTMSDLVPSQLEAMDDMARSDASSSSFNLSTDAEDSEYETLRRRGVLPIARPRNKGDNSVLSAISAPSQYTMEGERVLTSLTANDDGPSNDQNRSLSSHEQERNRGRAHQQPISMHQSKKHEYPDRSPDSNRLHVVKQNQGKNVFAMNSGTNDDLRAWGVDPNNESNTNTGVAASSIPSRSPKHNSRFQFEDSFSPKQRNDTRNGDGGLKLRNSPPMDPPASTSSRSTSARNFSSPTATTPDSGGFTPDSTFSDFVDFNTFGNNAFASHHSTQPQQREEESSLRVSRNQAQDWREEKKSQEPRERSMLAFDIDRQSERIDDSISSPPNEADNLTQRSSDQINHYSQSSPGGTDTSLSDLLAQAKSKQRRGNRSRSGRASTASVNSAPAVTASYLRQHHALGKNTGASTTGSDRLSSSEVASVSDIISNLEASNQSRLQSGTSRTSRSHRSVGDAGAVSTARAVKERLREKRRKERESGVSSEGSSSEISDNEAAESWLFDEVTGALGPRGITADLESLSGRSNRSKESRGNNLSFKPQASRSRRNRQTGSRRGKSSGDSVDSRGSRASRASRYSHRSTKSFLSQMSEQSRSVANDLLRLEMQLAMVGNAEKNGTPTSAQGGNGSASKISRGMRHSLSSPPSSSRSPLNASQSSALSATAGRTQLQVVAPPGKLGIILANKADAKGTVVSGVRTTSVLVDRINPGDRIVAIDGEDVSRMTVSEITTIMSRKADYDRHLTVLTIPKQDSHFVEADINNGRGGGGVARSPSGMSSGRSPVNGLSDPFDPVSFGHFRR